MEHNKQVEENAQPTEVGETEATSQASDTPIPVTVETIDSNERPDSHPAERLAGSARSQAEMAAGALRRGEFIRDTTFDDSADSDDRLIALLCYVTQVLIPLVMPLLVLVSESSKKRPFQRFHAVQSLALALFFIGFGLFITVGSMIVAMVPIIGWLVVGIVVCLSPLLFLMAYLALAYYGYQAYQGKRFAIPGLTSFLQDQNWL